LHLSYIVISEKILVIENNIQISLIQEIIASLNQLLAGFIEKEMLCMENLIDML
jgi:hypothetical protein